MQSTSLARLKQALGQATAVVSKSVLEQIEDVYLASSKGVWQITTVGGLCKVVATQVQGKRESMTNPGIISKLEDAEFISVVHNHIGSLITSAKLLFEVQQMASISGRIDDELQERINDALSPLTVMEAATETINLDPLPYDSAKGAQIVTEMLDSLRDREFKVPRMVEVLESVVAMSGAHIEDIETGLEDGTYERSENLDLPKKKLALQDIETMLSFITQVRDSAG